MLGGIAFASVMTKKKSPDLINSYMDASFIPDAMKYVFLGLVFVSIWIQMVQYTFQIYKQIRNVISLSQESERWRMVLVQLLVLCCSLALSLLDPPIFLPLLLMGSVTQLFLSFIVPNLLYQRSLIQKNEHLSKESIVLWVLLFVELAFGFLSMLSVILLTGKYYEWGSS